MKTKTILGTRCFKACALVLFFAPGCFRGPEPSAAVTLPPAPRRLVILTPHNENIRQAFEVGFADWYLGRTGEHVNIEWIVRGTPQCVAYVDDVFQGSDQSPRRLPEILFGGGVEDHALVSARGQSAAIELADLLEDLPTELNGLTLRDPENRWFTTGLSSFGIVYHASVAQARKLPVPKTWADLADPRLSSWLAVADPRASGSHRRAMSYILESLGWDEGWRVITATLANSRSMVDGSRDALRLLECGAATATFAVNFDGLALAEQSNTQIGYVNPPGATGASPDVISVLKSAADLELATAFVKFCVLPEGQATWSVDAAARDGEGTTLYHYPINPQTYEQYPAAMSVKENPFKTDFGLHLDSTALTRQALAVELLVPALAGENHIPLQQVWAELHTAKADPDAINLLTSPLLPADEAYALAARSQASPADADAIRADLASRFHMRLDEVRAMMTR